jgi:hypothetical protein
MRLACVGLFWFCNQGSSNFRINILCDKFAAKAARRTQGLVSWSPVKAVNDPLSIAVT